jgi:hypothetical protein
MNEGCLYLSLTPEQVAALDAGGSLIHAVDPATHRRYVLIDEVPPQISVQELRAMLQEAIDQSDRGKCVPWDVEEIKQSLWRRLNLPAENPG